MVHRETDVEPECSVVFGGGRLRDEGGTDDRRIEITFKFCYFSRTGPHSDSEGVEAIDYEMAEKFDGPWQGYLEWRRKEWERTGMCPDSGFYVASQSAWLQSLPDFFRENYWHYVVDGRDGYVELIAKNFKWREWIWKDCHRDEAVRLGPAIGEGEGVA